MKKKGKTVQKPKNVKNQKDGYAKKQRVFNLIILDASGSMEVIAKQC